MTTRAPRQHHPAALLPLAEEAQLGRLDAAQRQLLVRLHHPLRLAEVDGVPEPPVVQPGPAVALEALHAGAVLGGARGDAVRGSGAAGEGGAADAGRGQVEGALDGELRGVEGAPAVAVVQGGAAQAQRGADGRAAHAQLAVRTHHLGLQVLPDRQPVGGYRHPAPVPAHQQLVEQQVGAYMRVGQPDAVPHDAARQVQIALGADPGGLHARDGAAHQAQRGEVALGQQQLLLEAAVVQLDVGDDGATG
ncbi:hypothetical protein GCM10020000_60210 [Streptomyces olivoverticillatus]